MKIFFGVIEDAEKFKSVAEIHNPCKGGDHYFCRKETLVCDDEFREKEEAHVFIRNFVKETAEKAKEEGYPLFLSQENGKLVLVEKPDGLD